MTSLLATLSSKASKAIKAQARAGIEDEIAKHIEAIAVRNQSRQSIAESGDVEAFAKVEAEIENLERLVRMKRLRIEQYEREALAKEQEKHRIARERHVEKLLELVAQRPGIALRIEKNFRAIIKDIGELTVATRKAALMEYDWLAARDPYGLDTLMFPSGLSRALGARLRELNFFTEAEAVDNVGVPVTEMQLYTSNVERRSLRDIFEDANDKLKKILEAELGNNA